MVESSRYQQDQLAISNKEKIDSLREFTVSPDGQETMINFVESLRSEVGNRSGWEAVCRQAEAEISLYPVTDEVLNKLNQSFSVFIDRMPPGHDRGHLSRDLLASLYLYGSTRNNISYKSDATAGLLAGIYHDIGTAIIPRYQDNKYGAGHAETGSYLFWQISEGLIDENTRKLACYAIAAHTHYLNDIKTSFPKDYLRKTYWDDLHQDDDGKLIGTAIHLTRCSDRADSNGVNLIFRHINANIDTLQQGGQEIHDDQWIDINRDSLIKVLTPIIREDQTKPLTTLEHVLRFAKSNDGTTPYSKNDHFFPEFKKILRLELAQFRDFMTSLNDHSSSINGNNLSSQETIKSFLYKFSKSDPHDFDQAWLSFTKIWPQINKDHQLRWYRGTAYAKSAYNDLLDFYQQELKSSDFPLTVDRTIDFLRH